MRPYIYLVKNLQDKIIYIGQQIGTKSIDEYKGSGLLLNRAYKKYGESYNVYSEIHHYEKLITQFDYGTNTTTSNKIQVDEDTYNSIVPQTNYFSLPTGEVSISVDKAAVSVYDYEYELNEKKRHIQVIKPMYYAQIMAEFETLTGTLPGHVRRLV